MSTDSRSPKYRAAHQHRPRRLISADLATIELHVISAAMVHSVKSLRLE